MERADMQPADIEPADMEPATFRSRGTDVYNSDDVASCRGAGSSRAGLAAAAVPEARREARCACGAGSRDAAEPAFTGRAANADRARTERRPDGIDPRRAGVPWRGFSGIVRRGQRAALLPLRHERLVHGDRELL